MSSSSASSSIIVMVSVNVKTRGSKILEEGGFLCSCVCVGERSAAILWNSRIPPFSIIRVWGGCAEWAPGMRRMGDQSTYFLMFFLCYMHRLCWEIFPNGPEWARMGPNGPHKLLRMGLVYVANSAEESVNKSVPEAPEAEQICAGPSKSASCKTNLRWTLQVCFL